MSKKPESHGRKFGIERAAALLVLNERGKALNINAVIDTLRVEGWQQSDFSMYRLVLDAVSLARKNAGIPVRGKSAQ